MNSPRKTAARKSKRSPNLLLASEDEIERSLSPERLTTSAALLFHMDRTRLAAMTFHQIETPRQGQPQIKPGRILTPADEAQILQMLTRPKEQAGLEIMPEGVLHAGPDHCMWMVPSAVRPMTLWMNDQYVTRDVCWPTLVMQAYNRALYIAALPGTGRPDAGTPLFHAPLGNIYATSELCLGDCAPPAGCQVRDIAEWNRIVYDTAFSHTNHTNAMTGKDTMKFWAAKRKKPIPVPSKALTPMRLTLGEWYSNVMQTGATR